MLVAPGALGPRARAPRSHSGPAHIPWPAGAGVLGCPIHPVLQTASPHPTSEFCYLFIYLFIHSFIHSYT